MIDSIIELRRGETQERLVELKRNLAPTEPILEGKACIYVTGSVGRGEASTYSDLDVFHPGELSISKLNTTS